LTPIEYQHTQTRLKEVLIFFSCFFIIEEHIFENHSHLKEKDSRMSRIMSLVQAPSGTPLKIMNILGGHGVRRRLIALGFHKDDMIELDSRAILRGPILVKNLTADTSVALGRGVAQKIMVEIIE